MAQIKFDAQLTGIDRVNQLLKDAEQRLNSLGDAGLSSFSGIDNRMSNLTKSLETLTSSQSGLKGIGNAFDELTQKSNKFLGQSYKGVIDAARVEVKHFEKQADDILKKLKDSEAELERFRSKKSTMAESDFQAGQALRQKEVTSTATAATAILEQKRQLERQIAISQPVNDKLYDVASRYGLGQYATVGGMLAAAPKVLGGAAGLYIGAEKAYEQYTAGNLRQDYTKQFESYLSQRRLSLSTAQSAINNDPTALLLQQNNLGLESAMTSDPSFKQNIETKYKLQTAWARALQGAAGGAAAGTFFGGPVGTAIGAAVGGIGGFLAGRTMEKTQSQLETEARSDLRSQDVEGYGLAGREAGAMAYRRESDLGNIQRLIGIAATQTLTSLIARQGVSMDRANPIINMMYQQGMSPIGRGDEIANFSMLSSRYGFSQATQQAQLRMAALNGTSLLGTQMNSLQMGTVSGLTGPQDIVARSGLNDYVSNRLNQRGFGETFMSQGAAVAGAVGASNQSLNANERLFQGTTSFETLQNKISGGGGMQTIMVQKLASLGITNAVAVDTFTKMDLTAKSTHEAISRYLNGKLSPEQVGQALGSTLDTAKNVFKSALGGSEIDRLNKATGKDVATLYMTGSQRAFDNTAGGGAGFFEAGKAAFNAPSATTPNIQQTQVSAADLRDQAQAGKEVAVDKAMEDMLQKTGNQVSDALTKAVLSGYQKTIEEIRKVGKGEPLAGTKAAADKNFENNMMQLGPPHLRKGR